MVIGKRRWALITKEEQLLLKSLRKGEQQTGHEIYIEYKDKADFVYLPYDS